VRTPDDVGQRAFEEEPLAVERRVASVVVRRAT
jgi:hypothetical protein